MTGLSCLPLGVGDETKCFFEICFRLVVTIGTTRITADTYGHVQHDAKIAALSVVSGALQRRELPSGCHRGPAHRG